MIHRANHYSLIEYRCSKLSDKKIMFGICARSTEVS